MFSRLDTMPACDGQRARRTYFDGTDRASRASLG